MDDITQFEKEPAYLRKKRANNPQNDEEEVSENPDYSKPSRFSIDENAEGIYLSDNNKYLDHNAD